VSDRSTILEAKGLVRRYPVDKGFWGRGSGRVVKAVDGLDLAIRRGETLAIVGESGCGKSTLARLLLRLEAPDDGEVWFDGYDLATLDNRAMRPLRRRLQIVFQDPFSSLNPRMSVREILEEPLIVHGMGTRPERDARVLEVARFVGLRGEQLGRYPHEFSGGQRQRIGIARALMAGPEILVGDEPVSALDVSVQAQVINLLADLKAHFRLTLVLISHDLAVVRHMADRVGVMYLGKLVELASTQELFEEPRHPYTRALLASVPQPDPDTRGRRRLLEGDVPSPVDPPEGCRFHTRCPYARERCSREAPDFEGDGLGHATACHFWQELPPAEDGGRQRPTPVPLVERLALFEAAWARAEQALPVKGNRRQRETATS
jgi:oligopeptide/dipeptide ABC transporter ATP-binding protein